MRFGIMKGLWGVCLAMMGLLSGQAQAPGLVAHLQVATAGVEIRRVNTQNWVPIKFESLLGTGDSVRTDDKGQALIMGFGGLLTVSVAPNSEIVLQTFNGTPDSFDWTLNVRSGFAVQTAVHKLPDAMHFGFMTP